jgi:hypothetical protein
MAVILKNTQEESIAEGNFNDSGDVIGLYSTNRSESQWDCLHKFSAGSGDLADIKFSRDGAHLIVWDSPLKCSVQILQINFGQRLVRYVRQVGLI